MHLKRGSGILIHPTSLPGRFGIGDLGPSATAFVEFLHQTGQRWWQLLPLGPPGAGNSPYQSHSSYAGNRLLISPEQMVADELLGPEDLEHYPRLPDDRVDFAAVAEAKDRLLRKAFERFDLADAGFEAFRVIASGWLPDYALYMALKEAHGGKSWNAWEPEIALRRPEAMARWRDRLVEEVRFVEFIQYVFDQQWNRLRDLCHEREIGLIGDIPIFVSQDSADVWARPDLFELDEHGRPTHVAGVPPDYFSEDGQLWGNPVYRWKAHADEHFAWWIARVKATTDRVDLVRLDHFRGFEAYWEVPADAPTAATGRWALGPGALFFEALREGLGGLPLIAEDLGAITFEVEALRDRFHLPGMRVLQFAFGDDPKADDYLPYKFVKNCIAYTGTHDNDTTVGWFTTEAAATTQSPELIAAERAFVRRFVGTDGSEVHWDLIRVLFGSIADTVITPMQDLLGLDSAARMNMPGQAEGNWAWRCPPGQPDQAVRDRLADLTAVYARWNGADVPARFRTPRRAPEPEIRLMGT